MPSLLSLGWDDDWARTRSEAGGDPSLIPARVSRIDRGLFTVLTADGPQRVGADPLLTVAVGDWVTVGPGPSSDGPWRLGTILARRCAFRRITDVAGAAEQVVAANVDTVLLVDGIDGQLSARHLERYLALAWQSGATPVVVVTKADLASPEQLRDHIAAVESTAVGVAVLPVSAVTGAGLDRLARYTARGRTVVLLGLSGAGKSTLVNVLAHDDHLATGAVRADGKGRHTTSHRELVLLSGGGLMIDTPGMRALSVSTAVEGVARAFADVEEASRRCRYSDCSHTDEEGCAVLAALASGELDATRVESWRHLMGESGPEDHQAVRLGVERAKRGKVTAKAARARARTAARTATPPADQ